MAKCPGAPPKRLHPKLTPLPSGEVIYRVHEARFSSTEFNPGVKGIGRFHPLDDPEEGRVPTLYGALDFETALCEALFRGRPRGSVIPAGKVRELSRSLLRTRRDLTLVSLYDGGLRAIGAKASTLIDSPGRCYPATARWASALYPSAPGTNGMIWRSRQRPRTDAMVLWRPRMPEQAFDVIETGTSLESPTLFLRVQQLASLYRITITTDDD